MRTVGGRFHAWLERDESCRPCQARFIPGDVDDHSTTGTIANGREPFVVGAYDAHSPERPVAPFSSRGPTRDGRPKPDLVAPGVQVLAARSAPWDSPGGDGLLTRKSGTSMAAPHVTGAVALCLERGAVDPGEVRDLLLSTAVGGDDPARLGHGYLDVERLLAALDRRRTAHHRKEIVMSPNRPARLYRDVVRHGPAGVPRWIDDRYVVVARPGEPPRVALQAGDVLVRIALGERDPGHMATLAGAALVPHDALDAARLRAEAEGPGHYALVVEDGPIAHGPATASPAASSDVTAASRPASCCCGRDLCPTRRSTTRSPRIGPRTSGR